MNIEQSWSHATCARCGNKVPTEVPRLAQRIAELEAENATLRADAERYRYARKHDLIGKFQRDSIGDCYCEMHCMNDAAIDAARGTTSPEN